MQQLSTVLLHEQASWLVPLQMRLKVSELQVAQLAAQLQALLSEKQQLEARNIVLDHTVKVAHRHAQESAADQVCMLCVEKVNLNSKL